MRPISSAPLEHEVVAQLSTVRIGRRQIEDPTSAVPSTNTERDRSPAFSAHRVRESRDIGRLRRRIGVGSQSPGSSRRRGDVRSLRWPKRHREAFEIERRAPARPSRRAPPGLGSRPARAALAADTPGAGVPTLDTWRVAPAGGQQEVGSCRSTPGDQQRRTPRQASPRVRTVSAIALHEALCCLSLWRPDTRGPPRCPDYLRGCT